MLMLAVVLAEDFNWIEATRNMPFIAGVAPFGCRRRREELKPRERHNDYDSLPRRLQF
jgi:hypothetical protein